MLLGGTVGAGGAGFVLQISAAPGLPELSLRAPRRPPTHFCIILQGLEARVN